MADPRPNINTYEPWRPGVPRITTVMVFIKGFGLDTRMKIAFVYLVTLIDGFET